jgi:hypothetical protein
MTYTNQDIIKAVHSLVPNAGFAVSDGDISSIVWDDARPQPTTEQLQTAVDYVVANAAINALREERDRRIAVTDWWVLPDRTPTAEQLAYRQALRDITNTYSSLDDVVWPTKPE